MARQKRCPPLARTVNGHTQKGPDDCPPYRAGSVYTSQARDARFAFSIPRPGNQLHRVVASSEARLRPGSTTAVLLMLGLGIKRLKGCFCFTTPLPSSFQMVT